MRFFRQVAGTLGVRVLIAGSNLLSGVIIARWLGSTGVGFWATLNVIILLAITLGGFGLQSTVTYLVARDRSIARMVLMNAIVFAVIVGGILAIAIALMANLIPGLLGDVPPLLVTIAALALPFQMLSYFCLGIYLGLERIRTYNLIDISMQLSVLSGAVLMLIALGQGITELVIFTTIANLAIAAVIVYLTIQATVGESRPEISRRLLMRKMLDHGSRFFVAVAAGIIILRGDLLIVNFFRSADEAGVYAVATQASIFLHLVPSIISTMLFPRTSAAQDTSGLMTCRVTRHAVFFLLIACFFAAPLSYLLPLLYGPAFGEVPTLFLILLPGVFLLGIETIQVQHFAGLGLPRQIPIFWLVAMVICIGLDLLLVPAFGARAAAAVSTFSYALMFVLVALLFRSQTGRSWSEIFIIRRSEMREIFHIYKTQPLNEHG